MIKLRSPSGYLWTPAEDQNLRDLLAAGRGHEGAAAALGRTKGAVVKRAHKLKITPAPIRSADAGSKEP